MTPDLRSRSFGSLTLAGIGDALGAQTEQWSIEEILARHGGLVTCFNVPPPDTFAGANHARSGEVTDDASQMYYLARALVAGGGSLSHEQWVACLLDWAATSPKANFMGPSSAAIVLALQRGEDPARVGVIGDSLRKVTTMGNTNGSAMRVAPCGLVHPGDIRAACELAFVTCLPSHDTDVAISAACAIAAGVAEAVVRPSDQLDAVLQACRQGARIGQEMGERRARSLPGPRMEARLEMALDIAASSRDDLAFMRKLEHHVGTSGLAAESVPAALGVLAYAKGDPLRTISISASIGNDTDTIATMAGAIAGALHGAEALPEPLFTEFRQANESTYRLGELADALAGLVASRPRGQAVS